MKLTKRSIDQLSCPPERKDILVFDSEVKGFGLRITASGAKIFIFQYRAGGRVRRKVLGEYGVLTVKVARDKAEILRGQVLEGADPVVSEATAKRDADRDASADALTFGRLVGMWRDAKKLSRRAKPLHGAFMTLHRHFGPWWSLPARSIDADEVAQRIEGIVEAGKPGAALSAFRICRGVYRWAVAARKVTASPFVGLAPPGKDGVRDRVLTNSELGEAWRAGSALGYPFGTCIQMMMLTLQRRSDVSGMKWSEISEDKISEDEIPKDMWIWNIEKQRYKTKVAHLVHITETARAVLRSVPRREGCDLVFTTDGLTHISGFSKAMRALKTAIAEERSQNTARPNQGPLDWIFHDFRRTGVTAMARMGHPPHVADKILGHRAGTLSGVAAIYQRYEFLRERAQAHSAWDKYVAAAAEGRNPK